MNSLHKEGNVLTKKFFIIVGVLFLIFFLRYLIQPIIIVESDKGIILSLPAKAGMPFSTRFIHSVQKTPVEEFFVVDDKCSGFILRSTRYHSFGVGLPFLSSDGNFRREGNDFIMDDMNRRIKTLDLRPGVGTELSLQIDDKNYQLYQIVPIGSLIRISIVPCYKKMF